MSLIIYDKNSNWSEKIYSKVNPAQIMVFCKRDEVQSEYCRCIENEIALDIPFFDNPDVKEYLADLGLKYGGDYTLECDEWYPTKQFVTYLNYTLQMSCIMLYAPHRTYIIKNECLFDLKYILPVLRKMDVYLIIDESSLPDLIEVVETGIEVILNGKLLNEMNREELRGYLIDIEQECIYLTRESDSRYFPSDFEKTRIFTPYKTTYRDYVLEAEHNPRNVEFLESSLETADEDITVVVNGENSFSSLFRKYPIHYLYEIDGQWKYLSDISWKYPSLEEIFSDIFLTYERRDYNPDRIIDVSSSTRMLVLVLDCNEVCEAKKYWENVAFVAKYDRTSKTIEICDKNKGILEFHELLQKSTDL